MGSMSHWLNRKYLSLYGIYLGLKRGSYLLSLGPMSHIAASTLGKVQQQPESSRSRGCVDHLILSIQQWSRRVMDRGGASINTTLMAAYSYVTRGSRTSKFYCNDMGILKAYVNVYVYIYISNKREMFSLWFIFIQTYVYVWIYCMCAYIYIYMWICAFFVSTHTCTCVYPHMYVSGFVYISVYTHKCVYPHMYLQLHTHTYVDLCVS